jgi:iron complex outermembrane receptor protein/outer membrane receptor for ferrienterochelin and colicins
MLRIYITLLLILFYEATLSQQIVRGVVLDSAGTQPLSGVTVKLPEIKQTTITDSTGHFIFRLNTSELKQKIRISYTGLANKGSTIQLPGKGEVMLHVHLQHTTNQLADVKVVAASKSNLRMEVLPTRVEVIGTEEIEEETQINPGNMLGLLGDVTGIQVQRTGAATGNADLRIQGLPGRYTQILRDGMPLFAGYSGSFGLLHLPPLDLKQVELIIGAASTLYGGGAIAGMMNLVSKTPKRNRPENSILLNRTSLLENNVKLFSSARNNHLGYTLFAGGNTQEAVDIYHNGFSTVPNVKSLFIHPRIFVYNHANSTFIVGYTLNAEDRKGGDMQVLEGKANTAHQFFIQNKSLRKTIDADWDYQLTNGAHLSLKGTTSLYKRKVLTDLFGMEAHQNLWYSELAYSKKNEHHNWVAGLNFNGDAFVKKQPESTLLTNQNGYTIGAYVQDDWRITSHLTAEAGMRFDYHSVYGKFLLPRISFMYRFSPQLTVPLGSGMGYKTPSLFSGDVDERFYRYLAGYTPGTIAEKSVGANFDVNYKLRTDEWQFTLNQSFFYTAIHHPLLLDSITNPYNMRWYNTAQNITTAGFETYLRAREDETELYLGYVYTNTKRQYDAQAPNFPLIAKHKIAALANIEPVDNVRVGLELSYTGQQYLDDGSSTRGYILSAAMLNYRFNKISVVLNCENLFNFKQGNFGQLVYPPYTNPVLSDIWGPLEGRIFNFSVQINW